MFANGLCARFNGGKCGINRFNIVVICLAGVGVVGTGALYLA